MNLHEYEYASALTDRIHDTAMWTRVDIASGTLSRADAATDHPPS